MNTADRSRVRSRRAPRNGAAVAAIVLLAALVGCKAHDRQQVRGWALVDPAQRHPIRVSEREVGMDLFVPRGASGLSRAQGHQAREFLNAWRQQGEGPILVRAPAGGPNETAALRALEDLRGVLRKDGVRAEAVIFEPYYSAGDPQAPVRISFLRYVAEGPDCGAWPTDLGFDPNNRGYHNFGCATQRNLAAMVANPRDLVEPRGMTPRSGERRDTVWGKWVRGETTSADRSSDERAGVSEVQGGGAN